MSANAFAGNVAAGRDAGADEYLVKPFSKDELLNGANALLSRTRQPTRTDPR